MFHIQNQCVLFFNFYINTIKIHYKQILKIHYKKILKYIQSLRLSSSWIYPDIYLMISNIVFIMMNTLTKMNTIFDTSKIGVAMSVTIFDPFVIISDIFTIISDISTIIYDICIIMLEMILQMLPKMLIMSDIIDMMVLSRFLTIAIDIVTETETVTETVIFNLI